jgi:23S rRNA pseudouridine2605 synthase
MRLQAYLARGGAAKSRRKAEALIVAGRVTLNGRPAELGASVSEGDRVLLDGEPVALPQEFAYYAMNKPAGYLSTLRDEPERNRPTIRDLMPAVPGLVPVGRLDAQTTGLILLTNDGQLAHHVAHPSAEIEKEYELTVRNPIPPDAMKALAAGPTLEDGPIRPPRLTTPRPQRATTRFNLIIHEGRKRIVRRACEAVGLSLVRLKRVRVGPVLLGDLPEGSHRPLSAEEIGGLR